MSTTTPRTDAKAERILQEFGSFNGVRFQLVCDFARELERELEEARKENNYLRGIVALNHEKCLHCGLEDKAKCTSGFPGCAWADDLMCGSDEQAKRLLSQLTAHKAALVKSREALEITQWGFNFRRCPVCAGWNCSPNGETDMKHTKVCPVPKALTAINEVLDDGPLPAPNKEQSNHK